LVRPVVPSPVRVVRVAAPGPTLWKFNGGSAGGGGGPRDDTSRVPGLTGGFLGTPASVLRAGADSSRIPRRREDRGSASPWTPARPSR